MASKRQRGVRVSPVKLQHALAESGLKTQTALAERIADQEQLESAPRGLVNKVFRGEPVDPRSVERVARALGVDAWALYATSDEPELSGAESGQSQATQTDHPQPMASRIMWWIAGIVIVLSLALLFAWQPHYSGPLPAQAGTDTDIPVRPRAQQPTVIVLPIAAPRALQLTQVLAKNLDSRWRVMPAISSDNAALPDAQSLLQQSAADRIVEGRTTTQGRWLGLTLFVHQPGSMQAVWQDVLPMRAATQHVDLLMDQAARSIATEQTLPPPALEAQTKYLTGRSFLDRARVEANIRRALTEFESALRIDPDYVYAYAGLCEALVMEQIRTGDVARLDEAEAECAKALELDDDNLEARRVQAYLDRKRGRVDQALAGFEWVLERSPDNIDALLGITDVYITQYQLSQDENAYTRALAAVRRARELAPDFWKTAFSLARIEYFGGNLQGAVQAAERAVQADENVLSLSNLGTYHFCDGDFAAARDVYIRVKNLSPVSFVGEQQLAAVNYNLGDFQAAVEGFKTSLDLHRQSGAAHDHRVWGNYADALRHAGDLRGSASSYAQAISLAEKALTEGDANPQHAIAKAYYYEMLSLADPQQTSQLASLEELEAFSETADPIYLMFLAIVYQNRGLHQRAEEFRQLASKGCPGIAVSPDYTAVTE